MRLCPTLTNNLPQNLFCTALVTKRFVSAEGRHFSALRRSKTSDRIQDRSSNPGIQNQVFKKLQSVDRQTVIPGSPTQSRSLAEVNGIINAQTPPLPNTVGFCECCAVKVVAANWRAHINSDDHKWNSQKAVIEKEGVVAPFPKGVRPYQHHVWCSVCDRQVGLRPASAIWDWDTHCQGQYHTALALKLRIASGALGTAPLTKPRKRKGLSVD